LRADCLHSPDSQLARVHKTEHQAATEIRQREYSDIIEAFDSKAGLRRVVLLGAPGSGKSTTLRRPAQEVAINAQSDHQEQVPIFVPLRGWEREESLGEFVEAYLNKSAPGLGTALPGIASPML
jgi:predicted NACHT family NTPase